MLFDYNIKDESIRKKMKVPSEIKLRNKLYYVILPKIYVFYLSDTIVE